MSGLVVKAQVRISRSHVSLQTLISDSSFLLMWSLGGKSDDFSNELPAIHLAQLDGVWGS